MVGCVMTEHEPVLGPVGVETEQLTEALPPQLRLLGGRRRDHDDRRVAGAALFDAERQAG
jgi:hypothetical protein